MIGQKFQENSEVKKYQKLWRFLKYRVPKFKFAQNFLKIVIPEKFTETFLTIFPKSFNNSDKTHFTFF